MSLRLCHSSVVLMLLVAGAASACRTSDSSLKDDTTPTPVTPTPEDTVSPPFASGQTGDLNWQLRFNFPVCDHSDQGQPAGAWCLPADDGPSTTKSGIVDLLNTWIDDPNVKSIRAAYFSFSNKKIVQRLCNAANQRGLKVKLYMHFEQIMGQAQILSTCSPGNIQVIPRGKAFNEPGGWLQHAKIFLASESEDPLPISAAGAASGRTRFSSSSANMSGYGLSLHFENWMFIEAPTSDYLTQANLCFFQAIEAMGQQDRALFASTFKQCREAIQGEQRSDIVFYPVPHNQVNPQAFKALEQAITGAEVSIKVAAHRLTTKTLYKKLAQKAATIPVKVVLDDDTLRTGVKNGGLVQDVGADDVLALRSLRDAGADIHVMQTNISAEGMRHLHHNKFMVIDEKLVFAGAGNFTNASMNASGLGNIEHFYVITVPEIVQAYSRAYDGLFGISTPLAQHPVAGNPERGINCPPNSFCEFVD